MEGGITEFVGYHPTDVFAEMGHEVPQLALFTTFTFSPGAFQQQYLSPLIQHGCGNITVLADRLGYSQSLFAAAAVNGVGTDYRLRQVTVPGAFHGKLVLIRTRTSMILGIGSGNLIASGLQTNAEVGSLYVVDQREQLEQLDNLMLRLRSMALLDGAEGGPVDPISVAQDVRVLTSLDSAIIDQMDLPADVRRIEIVSPFVDGQLEAITTMRELWPDARIRLRLDPGFGALDSSLLAFDDARTEILVPVEPKGDKEDDRRPAVHGKLICFVGDTTATALLGSANMSRPALLAKETFEAIVERRIPLHTVDKLLEVPRVRWRRARESDRRRFQFGPAPHPAGPLIAALSIRHLQATWSVRPIDTGTASIWCRGRCVFERPVSGVSVDGDRHTWECEIPDDVKDALSGSCYLEIQLDDNRLLRGWIEIMDMLDIAPEAKRQLVVLDAIASDPLTCKQDDVVRFIELLQRNLKSGGRRYFTGNAKHERKRTEEYGDAPIQRSLLLETGKGHGIGQALLLTHLVNRSLDTALRDLRFFRRDSGDRQSSRQQVSRSAPSATQGKDSDQDERLPPKIETVLGSLFGQLAEALDEAGDPREVAELISQVPTCLKALSYAAERWLPKSLVKGSLSQYFHKVAIACLAPGIASILHRNGAIRRLKPAERSALQGGAEFAMGIAMLQTYLALEHAMGSAVRGSVLKDMMDVAKEVAAPASDELAAAGDELWRLQFADNMEPPDVGHLLAELEREIGELPTLRDCRSALHELLALLKQGVQDESTLLPIAERASGKATAGSLLELVRGIGSRVQLLEIESISDACPKCFTILPIAVRSQLDNSTVVRRCGCGVLLVRSLLTLA